MFRPHLEILSQNQRRLWPELVEVSNWGFVLYGGTAVALRLGHRQSVDFDFFTDREFTSRALLKAFPFASESTVIQEAENTLDLAVDGVKLSFFGGLDLGRCGEPEWTPDGVVEVASLEDLLATKVVAILQRVAAKDYRDIAALINAGVGLDNGLAIACVTRGKAFQPAESLRALTYFHGGDLSTLSEAEKQTFIHASARLRLATLKTANRKKFSRLSSGKLR